MRDGIAIYAAGIAEEGRGFRSEHFADLYALESTNFWFRARNAVIVWTARAFGGRIGSLLEVGCGNGFVLAALGRAFPQARLTGTELFWEGLRRSRERLPDAELAQVDARALPFRREFDVIGAFDVLEHIDADETALAEMHRALKSGGRVILTVPQHMWLWSAADSFACHERRYRRGELEMKLRAAGFEILYSTSFVTLLLPLMVLSRWRSRTVRPEALDPTAELRLPGWLNWGLLAVMRIEFALIRAGLRMPYGGSRLVVARAVPDAPGPRQGRR